MKIFITSRVSGRGNKIGPVFLSVRLLVSTLTAEPFEVRISNLIQWCTLTISRMSTMGKVIGQRSRSPAWKMWFFGQCYCLFLFCVTWYITMALSMVSWGHVTSQHDVMTAYDVTWRHRHYCITGHHQKMSVGRKDYQTQVAGGASTLGRFILLCYWCKQCKKVSWCLYRFVENSEPAEQISLLTDDKHTKVKTYKDLSADPICMWGCGLY